MIPNQVSIYRKPQVRREVYRVANTTVELVCQRFVQKPARHAVEYNIDDTIPLQTLSFAESNLIASAALSYLNKIKYLHFLRFGIDKNERRFTWQVLGTFLSSETVWLLRLPSGKFTNVMRFKCCAKSLLHTQADRL